MIGIQDKRVRERGRSEGAKIYRERLERVKDKRECERRGEVRGRLFVPTTFDSLNY